MEFRVCPGVSQGLAISTKLNKKKKNGGILAGKGAVDGAEALGLSELKLVGVVFSSKAALIDS